LQVLADIQEAVSVNRASALGLGLAQTLAAFGEAFTHVCYVPTLGGELVFHRSFFSWVGLGGSFGDGGTGLALRKIGIKGLVSGELVSVSLRQSCDLVKFNDDGSSFKF